MLSLRDAGMVQHTKTNKQTKSLYEIQRPFHEKSLGDIRDTMNMLKGGTNWQPTE